VSILESQNGEAIKSHVSDLSKELHTIQLRMQMIEKDSQRNEGRWKTIANFVLNLLLYILVGYLLYEIQQN
jgi:hypothetical protein